MAFYSVFSRRVRVNHFYLSYHDRTRDRAKQHEQHLAPLTSVKRQQDWSWIWWCILAIVALFGFRYWVNIKYNQQVSSDWGHAYTLYQRKNYAGAEEYLQAYNDETGDVYGKGHYYLGLCLEGDGRIEEARDSFQETQRRSGPKGNYWSSITQDRYHNAQRELKKLALVTPR